MKTCVIIPTYNEANTILAVLERLRSFSVQVIVIDDGSSDNTGSIAQQAGAIVLHHSTNKGKGAALITGFEFALKNNFDAVITMDGDGQHLADDIPSFLTKAQTSASQIFIGNRMLTPKNMPRMRLLTNAAMSWFISKIIRQTIPDSQCGFRLIKREALAKIKLTTHNYETESELLIKAARLGITIESVPIKTIYNDNKSGINPLFDTLRFINFIFNELWILPRQEKRWLKNS
ncbi:MAG: glycosyltransferase family 2 protein [Candidatus Omnitrophica bacterium]|nr:glycosyltransferase family 2 protein [Candidatus Omnitrophota bacterium]